MDWQSRILTAVHETLVREIIGDVRSDRARELAVHAARVLGRARSDLQTMPGLATEALGQWSELRREAVHMLAGTLDGSDLAATGAQPALDDVQRLSLEIEGIRSLLSKSLRDGRGLAELDGANFPGASWFGRTVDAAVRLLDRRESALPAPLVLEKASSGDPKWLRARLSDYLEDRFPALPRGALRSLRIVPGGRSKITALVELATNEVLPSHLVLRMDAQGGGLTKTTVAAEYPLLCALRRAGAPVPVPVLAEKSADPLGGSFMITEEVRNARKGGEPFAELIDFNRLAPEFPRELARALSRQHAVRDWPLESTLGSDIDETASPKERLQSFYELWCRTAKPPMSIATELGFAWLLSHPMARPRPQAVVHGDLGMHNFLIRDGHLAAVLDWELSHLGDPAEDIGTCRAALIENLIPWEDFVAEYTLAGGEPAACDLDAVMYYSVWCHVRGSVYTAIMRQMALQDPLLDIEFVGIGWDFFERTQHYIARELRAVLSRVPA